MSKIDRAGLARELAKTIAYKQVGNYSEMAKHGRFLLTMLKASGIIACSKNPNPENPTEEFK